FVQGLGLAPLAFIMVAGTFRSTNPELEEAAAAHGIGFIRSLIRVTLPLIFPGILAAGIYILTIGLAAFEVPAVIGLSNRVFTFSRGFCGSILRRLPRSPLAASARRPLEHGGPDDLGLDRRAARQLGDFMDRRALESPRQIFTRRRRVSAARGAGDHLRPERGVCCAFFAARLRADLRDGFSDHGRLHS